MERIAINDQIEARVTQMRRGDSFGDHPDQLEDGNMIPRLCNFVGKAACEETCRLLKTFPAWPDPKPGLREFQEVSATQCAEVNILTTLEKLGTKPANFVLTSCTGDRIAFGDDLSAADASHGSGYTFVPATNAFFFRPRKDKAPSGAPLTHAAMRMADCGGVIYDFTDKNDKPVTGIAHFSRTNMRGPSAFMHKLNGQKVSWGEFVIGSALEHYGANPASVKIKLVAAVDRDDFVHNFSDSAKMEKTFPGWNELGFMHPQSEQNFDCLIDYREMIEWQLGASVQNPNYRLDASQIDTSEVINTGDLSLGHASHRAASAGKIAHGRDLYIVGSYSK